MVVLEIIGLLFLAVLLIFLFAVLAFLPFYYVCFYWQSCDKCGCTMEYKGCKEEDGTSYYIFHCPKCGAVQKLHKDGFMYKTWLNKQGYENSYK